MALIKNARLHTRLHRLDCLGMINDGFHMRCIRMRKRYSYVFMAVCLVGLLYAAGCSKATPDYILLLRQAVVATQGAGVNESLKVKYWDGVMPDTEVIPWESPGMIHIGKQADCRGKNTVVLGWRDLRFRIFAIYGPMGPITAFDISLCNTGNKDITINPTLWKLKETGTANASLPCEIAYGARRDEGEWRVSVDPKQYPPDIKDNTYLTYSDGPGGSPAGRPLIFQETFGEITIPAGKQMYLFIAYPLRLCNDATFEIRIPGENGNPTRIMRMDLQFIKEADFTKISELSKVFMMDTYPVVSDSLLSLQGAE